MKSSAQIACAMLAAALVACAPKPSEDPYRRLAENELSKAEGAGFRGINEMKVSPSGLVACGTIKTRTFGNIFAIVLDQPIPRQGRVEVKIPSPLKPNPTQDERDHWGKETVRQMKDITVLCQEGGAPLPFHRQSS